MLTGGVAGLCVEGQHLHVLVIGAGGQQLAAVAPGHAVDGPLVVLIPLEADDGLLSGVRATGGSVMGTAALGLMSRLTSTEIKAKKKKKTLGGIKTYPYL